jgi:MFS family permease
VLLGTALLVASLQILVPVVPVLVERSGPHGAAGAATATLFIAMVGGELVTPWLQTKLDAAKLMIASAIVVAVPSLTYLIPQANVFALLSAAAFRGLGLGVVIVVSVVLVTELAAPNRRGRAIGAFGVATGIPGVICPSVGVWLLAAGHADWAAAIAFSSGVLAALITAIGLPRAWPANPLRVNLRIVLHRPSLLIVFAGFGLVSSTNGGVVTYVPVALPVSGFASAAAFFLILGTSRLIGRWLSGVIGDYYPVRGILAGGTVLIVVGLATLAASHAPLQVSIAAITYGFGYGAVQTGAYLSMAARSSPSDRALVGALWNGAIDMGTAAGGAMIGFTAAFHGYTNAFWLMPVAAVAALPTLLIAGGGRTTTAQVSSVDSTCSR